MCSQLREVLAFAQYLPKIFREMPIFRLTLIPSFSKVHLNAATTAEGQSAALFNNVKTSQQAPSQSGY